MRKPQGSPPVKMKPVMVGCGVSVGLLCLFCYLKIVGSSAIELPAQWLWVSLTPILVGLFLGRYISKLELPGGLKIEIPQLTSAPPQGRKVLDVSSTASTLKAAYDNNMKENDTNRRLFLVHALKPSALSGMKYDVSIFLMRHIPEKKLNQVTDFHDVEKAEFYFGENWAGMFSVTNPGEGYIGISTSAWGQFLEVCRVTFKSDKKNEGQTAILSRYIDFVMSP